MSSTIALLVSDVDGTLVTNEKKLTGASVAAVRRLRDAGIGFALISGRPPRGMRMISEPLAVTTTISGFNGGLATSPDFREIVTARYLPTAVVREVIAELDGRGLDVWLYTDDRWLVRDRRAPHVARESMTVQLEPDEVARFDEGMFEAVIKIVGVSDDPPRIEDARTVIGAQTGEFVVAGCSQPYYLDFTGKLANKGEAVAVLARQLGLRAEQIATIGDMPTDIPMFKRAGMSIAMGNASATVRAEAEHVTDTNERDGFAKAVDRFVLGRSS